MFTRESWGVPAGVLLVLILTLPGGAAALTRLSVAADGTAADGDSSAPVASSDGRIVAFASVAGNLVAGGNGMPFCSQILVLDRQTAAFERVSTAADGTPGDGPSQTPQLSADGRYVAFASVAANLVADDTNGHADIFVFDRQTGVPGRVSLGVGGTQADGASQAPALSGDGRYVVFASEAANLVAGDGNAVHDIFLFDRVLLTTARLSVGPGGGDANGASHWPTISADGRWVAFQSDASNLVPDDTNGATDLFLWDRDNASLTLLSRGLGGVPANGGSYVPVVSADGSCVAFDSDAADLVSGDTNGHTDVFVYDRPTGNIARVSLASAGGEADGDSFVARVSSNGQCVAFLSSAGNLTAEGAGAGNPNVFVHDRLAGTMLCASRADDGSWANGWIDAPAISGDGRFVLFVSAADNLVPDDTNGAADIFARDLNPAQDAWPPRVLALTPEPGSTVGTLDMVAVSCSEALHAGSVSGDTVRVLQAPGADGVWGTADDSVLAGTVQYTPGSPTLSFTPAAPVTTSGTYALWLDGNRLTDLNGNALDGEFAGTFPSGDGAGGGDFLATFVLALASPAPGALDLLAGSDTGRDATDDLTRLNNASPASALGVRVTGTVPGSTVTLYAGAVPLGAAVAAGDTTDMVTAGTAQLPDGPCTLVARQQVPGAAESEASPALTITIDTGGPRVLQVRPRPGLAAATVHTVTASFDEVLDPAGVTPASCRVASEPGPDGSWGSADDVCLPGAPMCAADGSTVSITLRARPSPGQYAVLLEGAAGLCDLAGNPLDGEYPGLSGGFPSGDGSPGGLFVSPFQITAVPLAATWTEPRFPGRVLAVGQAPLSLAVADVDRDGRPDVAVALGEGQGLSVLTNQGGGRFSPAVHYDGWFSPQAVVAARIDGDAHVDLAVLYESPDTVSVRLNRGDGTFRDAVDYPVGASPRALLAADLNGDGRTDLVSANAGDADLAVLLGAAGGGFLPAIRNALAGQPVCLAAADLDDDGKVDLACGFGENAEGFAVLAGLGDGTFAPATAYPGGTVSNLRAGDWNGDGHPDLASVGGGSLRLHWGLPAGGFAAPDSLLALAGEPAELIQIDLDGDGLEDVVVVDTAGLAVVLLNAGQGAFAPPETCPASAWPRAAAAADVDGDGHADLLIVDSRLDGVVLLTGNGDGTLHARTDQAAPAAATAAAVADLNGDGCLDLVAVGGRDDSQATVFLGRGDGRLGAAHTFTCGTAVTALALTDVNRDDCPDLVLADGDGKAVRLLPGRGDGTFLPVLVSDLDPQQPVALAAADLNADGLPDLAVGLWCPSLAETRIGILLGQAGGTFAPPLYRPTLPGLREVLLHDANCDGQLDLVVACADNLEASAGVVAVFPGCGDGTFQEGLAQPLAIAPGAIAAGDVNRDGVPDLILADGGAAGSALATLLGRGDGTFEAGAPGVVAAATRALELVDLDGDGDLDLVQASAAEPVVGVLLGDGQGGWQALPSSALGDPAPVLAVADLNDDGFPDLVGVSDAASATVSILLNGGHRRSFIDAPIRGGGILAGDTLRFAGTFWVPESLRPATVVWDFGDGRCGQFAAPGLVAFPDPGPRLVRFAATDCRGRTDPYPDGLDLDVVPDTGAGVPDLEVVSLEPPAAWPLGQPGTVRFTVRNGGDAAVDGISWTDAIYLSEDAVLDRRDTRLGSLAVSSGLAPGGTYQGQIVATLPAGLGGSAYFLLLAVDDTWVLLERQQLNNEAAALVEPTVPLLANQTAVTGVLPGSGAVHYYRLEVPDTRSLVVFLETVGRVAGVELYLRYGELPSRWAYDYSTSGQAAASWATPTAGEHRLAVDAAAPGSWYVLVYGQNIPTPTGYALVADIASELALDSVSPSLYACVDGARLVVRGNGFATATQVELFAPGGSAYAGIPTRVTATEIEATFDLAGAAPGHYTLRATDPGITHVELNAAVELVDDGASSLVAQVLVPDALGWHNPSTLYIEYTNAGDAPLAGGAPLFVLDVLVHLLPGEVEFRTDAKLTVVPERIERALWGEAVPLWGTNSLQILGSGASPGVLQPHETRRLPVYWCGWTPPYLAGMPFEFSLRVVHADNPTPAPWDGIKATMRPPGLQDEVWEAVWTNFRSAVGGDTWGAYVRMLNANAAYLGRLGLEVADADDLLWYEVQQAIGLTPHPDIEPIVDAVAPGPGIEVRLERVFPNSLVERWRQGPFGRGWYHNWEVTLETQDADAVVVIRQAGAADRVFQRDARGYGYLGDPEDRGTLAKVGSVFHLTEANGTLVVFRTDGRLDYVQDRNGNRVTATYDGALRLSALSHSSGEALTLEYNASGLIERLTDGRGRQTLYAYDDAGPYLTTVTRPDGSPIQYRYLSGQGAASEHALTGIELPDGVRRHYTYDAQGRLETMFFGDPGEPVEFLRFGYGTAGEVTATDALDQTTRYHFDHHGHLARVEQPGGQTVDLTSAEDATLRSIRDPAGLTDTLRYDARGRLTALADPLGNTSAYRHTDAGHVIRITDPKGNPIQFEYDERGNRTRILYADGSAEAFTYDARGCVASWTNRRGQTVTTEHDAVGRLVRKTYPDASVITYEYDDRGNLEQVTDAAGITTYAYDAADRLTRIAYANGRALDFTYTAVGQLATCTDHTGYRLQYGYDGAGRLTTVAEDGGPLLMRYVYDAGGRLQRREAGNGVVSVSSYDASGRLASLTNHGPDGQPMSRFAYAYNPDARRVTMDTAEGLWTYTHSVAGELVRAQFQSSHPDLPDLDLSYAYDAAGNRRQVAADGASIDYTVNGLNQYTRVGDLACTYDADGNLVRTEAADGRVVTYTYDVENRLVAVDDGEHVYTQSYDALGRLVASSRDGQRTEYLINPHGLGDTVAAYNGAGDLLVRYLHGLGLIAQAQPGTPPAYYSFSPLGHTSEVTDAAGAVLNRYRYLPFGETLSASETVPNPFTFVGQFGVADHGCGLLYMRLRHYDRLTGRFTSDDPQLGAPHQAYTYAGNDPTSHIDPLGLATFACQGSMSEARARQIRKHQLGKEKVDRLYESVNNLRAGLAKTSNFADAAGLATSASGGMATGSGASSIGLTLVTMTVGQVQGEISSAIMDRLTQTFERWYGGPMDPCILNLLDDVDQQRILKAVRQLVKPPRNRKPGADAHRPQPPATRVAGGAARSVASVDPNRKVGPSGTGDAAFVGTGVTLAYRVDFENDAAATAPAQRVLVTDRLADSLDLDSFSFTGFGFGTYGAALPAGTQHHAAVVPLVCAGQDLDVHVTLDVDPASRLATAVFQCLDPDTGLPPDALTGFLPPEDGSGRGRGHASFVVRPRAGLPTGTAIRNVADITFDFGETIATNQVDPHDPGAGTDPAREALVTLDGDPPASRVAPFDGDRPSSTFLVTWSGSDGAGAGVAAYDVFAQDDGGPWALWLEATAETEALFAGENGHTYGFYSQATDGVGHREIKPAAADATTTVTLTCRIALAVEPPGRGSVGGGGTYPCGTLVTVWAEPAVGWHFVDWIDGATPVASESTYTFEATEDRTLTACFRPADPVAPAGDFLAVVGAADVAAGRAWWDLTGTYSTTLLGSPFSLDLVHDPGGKLSGAATYTMAKDTTIVMPIKGCIKGSRGSLTLNGTLKGSDPERTTNVALTLKLALNAATRQIVGPLTGKVRAAGLTTPVHENLALNIPSDVDGTWALSVHLVPTDTTLTGTATLTLTHRASHRFLVTGKIAGQTAALTLHRDPADPTARAFKIRTIITPQESGWADLESFMGLGYGQTIRW